MAYRLTDQRGNCAYVWWEETPTIAPVIVANDPPFRARLMHALSQPIFVHEDLLDEHGFAVTTRVQVASNDPRYPSQVAFRWHQIGLGDLATVDVVRRDEINARPVDR